MKVGMNIKLDLEKMSRKIGIRQLLLYCEKF